MRARVVFLLGCSIVSWGTIAAMVYGLMLAGCAMNIGNCGTSTASTNSRAVDIGGVDVEPLLERRP